MKTIADILQQDKTFTTLFKKSVLRGPAQSHQLLAAKMQVKMIKLALNL